jgi:hypothetical protein
MVRMVYLTLAVAVAIGISAASAQTNGQPSSKVQSMTGVVKAVFASSLTLERGGNEIRFGVNRSTRVFAKRRGTAGDLVGRPGGRPLTDFVKVGDHVTVSYRQSGSALNAVEVRIDQK